LVFCLYLHVNFRKNMIQSRLYLALIVLSTILFTSCKDSDEYRVDSEFADYLNRFIVQAALHGRTFNPSKDGLIIEFADLKNNNAGLTHYENPIRIEIDRTYWNAISKHGNSKWASADLMKENLIFHELGHGLLGRDHLNTTLENGDWKSIMCGGDKVNGRAWNINYRGVRRTYYIDELFKENTSAPDFASNLFFADTLGFQSKLYYNFNSTSSVGWLLTEDSIRKTSIENGRLRFESKIAQSCLALIKTSIDVQSDFMFELNIQYNSTDVSNQYGMVFGSHTDGSTTGIEPLEYFSINNNKNMYMGNRTWYSFYTELPESQILAKGANTLKVFKLGTIIYYFINNVYSYCSEMEIAFSGVHFGFLVPPKGVVLIDNFSILQKKTTAASVKSKQNQPLEFSTTVIPSVNQGVVLGN